MKCVFGWAGVRYVITKFSWMDSLPNFLTHGAPLRACFARARAPLIIVIIIIIIIIKIITTIIMIIVMIMKMIKIMIMIVMNSHQ